MILGFLEIIIDVDGLLRSISMVVFFVVLAACGCVVMVGGKDLSWLASGLVLIVLGTAGAWYYLRLARRLIRKYRESEEQPD